MSTRRIVLWGLVTVVVLALIVGGMWLFARAGLFPGAMGYGFAGRGIPEGGRFFNMPHHYWMMPGTAWGIGFPAFGWVGSILVFAFGVAVGLILAAIGRRPSDSQSPPGGTEAGMPASFEAWHRQLHEAEEANRPATKRTRRS